jgi:hypothetical protein
MVKFQAAARDTRAAAKRARNDETVGISANLDVLQEGGKAK